MFSAFSLITFAQTKKVSVYVSGPQKYDGIKKVLGDQLASAFANSGKYIAVERTASFLAEIMKEKKYMEIVSDADIAQLGKQFGSEYVCVADISDVYDEKYISVKLIDVGTAEIVKASNTSSKLSTKEDLLNVTKLLASDLILTNQEKQEIAKNEAKIQRENEAQKEREKIVQELRRTLSQGYIKIENLYVTCPALTQNSKWASVRNMPSNCRLGGVYPWRFPTEQEAKRIHRYFKQLFYDSYFAYQLIEGIIGYTEYETMKFGNFWLANGDYEGRKEDSQYVVLVW